MQRGVWCRVVEAGPFLALLASRIEILCGQLQKASEGSVVMW